MSKGADLLKLLCRPGWACGTDLLADYERRFAEEVLADASVPVLAFGKGRVALWAILRALQVTGDDEVILPAYTCETVPIAVKFTGVRCRYADVGPGQFNTTARGIAELISDRTRAVVCQHTYGAAHPVRELAERISRGGAALIEDCCQLICPRSSEGPVATAGDAAIFSTHWSKPFTTGLGGLAAFGRADLSEAVAKVRDGFDRRADRARSRSLVLQSILYGLTVRPFTRAVIARVYRWVQACGLVRGGTAPAEYGRTMPEGFLTGATNVQAVLGLRALARWQENVQWRRDLTAFYLEELTSFGVDTTLLRAGTEEPALWGVPVLVENKDEILARAGRRGLPVLTWYARTPVHIAPDFAARYDYEPGQCPRAERMFAREIYLSTSPGVKRPRAEAAVRMLKKHARLSDCAEVFA